MRIDKFLKITSIVKRRTIAALLCSSGNVKVNDRIAKPGCIIKAGDKISISFSSRILFIEVMEVPVKSASKDKAQHLYKMVDLK